MTHKINNERKNCFYKIKTINVSNIKVSVPIFPSAHLLSTPCIFFPEILTGIFA
jgi:hypothetical protein